MRRLILVAWLLVASSAFADAPSYRVIVDRVELESASITGQRLRVYLSALSLEGQRLDLTDPKSIRLYVGSSEKKVPYALGTYDATGGDTAVVVLVQVSVDWTDALPTIAETLDRELLSALGERAQVAIIPFGEAVAAGKLEKVKHARGRLGALSSDGSAGDPGLLDAVDRALILLRRAKSDPEGRAMRKIMIVIGDGRDRGGDRDRVTAVGKRAAKEGVRIHAVAYSPADVRRPLLVLGELAKRSMGTFRWPGRGHRPTADSWSEAFKQLREEIVKQYVLTYFVNADDDVAGKKLHVVTSGRTEATSNDVKIPDAPTCAGNPCDVGYCANDVCVVTSASSGHGVLRWILIIGGSVVGALVLLGFIGYLMSKKQPKLQMPAGMVMQQPQAMPQQPVMPAGRPPPMLLVMNGPLAGQRVPLFNGFLIGKQPGCHLVLPDGTASSQHAQISVDAYGNCKIYDRGSTNGTFLNGVPVREVALENGAMIRIGSTELRFLAQ